MAWAWLRLVARQALSCPFPQLLLPPPGLDSSRDPLTWRRLLVRDLRGVLQVAAVLRAAVSVDGRSGGEGGGEGQGALHAAVEDVLSAALYELEILLVTDMEEVAKCLGINVLARREREGAAAAAVSSAAWRTVVKQLTYATTPLRHLANKTVYTVTVQLLASMVHLWAPPVRPPGEQQGQESGGAGGAGGAGAAAGCGAAAVGGVSLSGGVGPSSGGNSSGSSGSGGGAMTGGGGASGRA